MNFDDITRENIKEHNPNWSQIPDHQNRILITGGFGSKKKTDKLLDLISQQADTDEFYLYAEDPYEANIDSKAFIECSNNIDDIYKSRGDNNFKKKRKIISLVFVIQTNFPVPEDIRLNSIHYYVIKNQNN